jgi:hypothetical protein
MHPQQRKVKLWKMRFPCVAGVGYNPFDAESVVDISLDVTRGFFGCVRPCCLMEADTEKIPDRFQRLTSSILMAFPILGFLPTTGPADSQLKSHTDPVGGELRSRLVNPCRKNRQVDFSKGGLRICHGIIGGKLESDMLVGEIVKSGELSFMSTSAKPNGGITWMRRSPPQRPS